MNEKYVNNLAAMIKTETVSYDEQPDKSKFYAFHELLKKLFPSLFAVVEVEVFDGSLLMKWKGKNPNASPVMLMNHMDVVEAHGDWSHDPFCGEVFDGKLWGRGTLDNKGGLWGMLQAADELAAEGFVPETDIYFESACTEEVGGEGAKEISKVLYDRGIRFSMILDEGGMIVEEPIAGAKGKFAMVGMGEKGVAELKFIARGNGGHASTPDRNTPLVRLGKFMQAADSQSIFKAELTPVIEEMFSRIGPSVDGPLGKVLSNAGKFKPVLLAVMPKVSATANALVRTTIAFTMAHGSEGRNVIPAEAWVVGNLRISHHQGYESSLAAIKKLAAKYDIETEILSPCDESSLSDFRTDAFRQIEDAVSAAFDNVTTVPYIMTGASDCRFMEKLSKNCFRFVPFVINGQQLESIHGLDENVDVVTLEPAVKFYKHLIKGIK